MGPWRNLCRVPRCPSIRVNHFARIIKAEIDILLGSALLMAGRGFSVHERHKMLLERSDLTQKGLYRLAERSTKST